MIILHDWHVLAPPAPASPHQSTRHGLHDSTGRRLPDLMKDVRFVEFAGGPHNIDWTHPENVNKALLDFLSG